MKKKEFSNLSLLYAGFYFTKVKLYPAYNN